MSLNPYEASQVRGRPPRSQPWNPVWLFVPFAWTAFICVTGAFADHIRYSSSYVEFVSFALVIGTGAIASLVCLKKCVRGWWHLLVLPIWLLLLTELLILSMATIRVVVFSFGGS